ncbi:MAG TPA: FkbM family methyltransferase [Stellaceae bacterium]|nr:FkbM family methyltransferase [Stellaceae bacterium]
MPTKRIFRFGRRSIRSLRRRALRLLYGPPPPEAPHFAPSWKSQLIAKFVTANDGDFIDVGANTGQTLLEFLVADTASRYIGFEPNPEAFAVLFAADTGAKPGNRLILPFGLSDKTERVDLYAKRGILADSTASVIADLRPGRRVRRIPVFCYRFDDLRDFLGIRAISLIKIDVEGAELAVLRGMAATIRELRPPILCEILYADVNADLTRFAATMQEISGLLADLNYRIHRIKKNDDDFSDLEELRSLPVCVWTAENAGECDYLLLPGEKRAAFA